jgi:signal transduction histidine kinase
MMYDFLKNVPLFSELPEADLRQLCPAIVEVRLNAGEELFAEGTTGDRAYVIQHGQLEIIKNSNEGEVLLAVREPGEVIGEMSLLESTPRMASVRARTDSLLIAITKEQLDELLTTSPTAANAMFRTVLSRWRSTEAMLRQSEKMAQLGTLTAGVAHELNNPAAAVNRNAEQLENAVDHLTQAQANLIRLSATDAQQETISKLEAQAIEKAAHPPEMDSLTRSDRQVEIEDWLETRGWEDAWELSPSLVDIDFQVSDLEALTNQFASNQLNILLDWLCATYTTYNLLTAVKIGSGRISEIVKALKTYSYLDQAPVQNIDIHEGLDNTLLILANKIKSGIDIRREYANDLPTVQAYGSELNQVWTNIIDNAIDALDGKGVITIRTRKEGQGIFVEIEDNGPGIPPEIQSRIFDAFFTTKPVGKGTGLGLDISYNIVVQKHRGKINVTSEPGRTCFQIWLPLNFEDR